MATCNSLGGITDTSVRVEVTRGGPDLVLPECKAKSFAIYLWVLCGIMDYQERYGEECLTDCVISRACGSRETSVLLARA
jgi:hypothetical protein